MLLSIDLLKGQGIPIKSRPGGAAILAITIAVPVIAAIIMVGDYASDRIILMNQKRNLAKIETEISQLSGGMEFQEAVKKEISNINACLKETADAMKLQIQWSPILELIVQNIPENLVLSELSVRTENVQREFPRRDDPSRNITLAIQRRILTITLYGNIGHQSDEAALEFLRSLSASTALNTKIEDIRPIAQITDEENKKVRYSIECVFKVL
jgi:Tfp pilus assembly protein PilN